MIKNRNKILIVGLVLLVGAAVLTHKSENYLKRRIMRLSSPKGMCTGEQVRAPSGKDYVLTAGHCDGLIVNGKVQAELDNGRKLKLKVIEESDESDLMLLEGVPGLQGLDIASTSFAGDDIRTLTKGHDFPTYRTEGVLIRNKHIEVLLKFIMSPEDEANCHKPKNEIVDAVFVKVCLLVEDVTATTAFISPGSSGGAAYNAAGDIVGIVSAGGEGYGFFVTLQDIKAFLRNY